MVEKVVGAVAGSAAPASPGASFGKELSQAVSKSATRGKGVGVQFPGNSRPPGSNGANPTSAPGAPNTVGPTSSAPARTSGPNAVEGRLAVERPAGGVIRQVERAQSRLDHILKLAESGRTFSPAELLALQAHTYRASQELDMAGKVVEKGIAAVKQTLQTQI